MAEFVEKRCEDMLPMLEQMERIKLFDKTEIRAIAKKHKEFEYKIQRHTKCREDYEEYIRYKMNLLALIKQRRHKYNMLKKKSDIDFAIANKVNNLYKAAIFKFNDIGLWLDYIVFCKEVRFYSNVSYMLGKMLQVHGDKPRCWHIAACWELEENNDREKARHYLLNGLHIHLSSQLLYIEIFRLELEDYITVSSNTKDPEDQEGNSASTEEDKMPLPLMKAYVIYQQAYEHVDDVRFIIKLLSITEEYNKTEELQKRIISDMIRDYSDEALTWDKMAQRELKGLTQFHDANTLIELDSEEVLLRDRITCCNKVYQTALENINTEEMWSLYIECLVNINRDLQVLPNFKRKLLKTALMQANEAKTLTEKQYLYWINMLSAKINDEDAQMKLYTVLCEATDAIPSSVILWHARMKHMLLSGLEKEANETYSKATKVLREKALPLWKMRIWHVRTTNSEKTEKAFQAALQVHPLIARDIKPLYIEWLALTKGIDAARKAYDSLCLQPPFSLGLHKKMASLEVMQPDVSITHARRPHELATHLFGKKDKSVWMDHIKFEWKYGEPWDGGRIYDRALKNLNGSLTSSFIEDFVSMRLELDNTSKHSEKMDTDSDAESEYSAHINNG